MSFQRFAGMPVPQDGAIWAAWSTQAVSRLQTQYHNLRVRVFACVVRCDDKGFIYPELPL